MPDKDMVTDYGFHNLGEGRSALPDKREFRPQGIPRPNRAVHPVPNGELRDALFHELRHLGQLLPPPAVVPARAVLTLAGPALGGLLAGRAALSALAGDLTVTRADARELLAALPDDLPQERRDVAEAACQLVGKATYFWGGKRLVLGWDSRFFFLPTNKEKMRPARFDRKERAGQAILASYRSVRSDFLSTFT